MKLTDFINKYYYIIIPLFLFVMFFQITEFSLVGFEDNLLLGDGFSRIATKDRIGIEIFKGYLNTDSYRPVTNSFYWVVAQIGGNNPIFFRTANLILLSILALLLVQLLQLFGYKRHISVIATFLFTIHPLIFSSIGWIGSSSLLLSSIFAVISIIFLDKKAGANKNFFNILHFLAFFLSILSNECAFVLPLIYVAYLYFKNSFSDKSLLIKLSIGWVLSIGIYLLMLSKVTLGIELFHFRIENLILNLQLIPELFANIILPFDLSVISSYSNFWSMIGLFLIVALFAIAKFKNVLNTTISKISFSWIILSALPFMLIVPSNTFNLYNYINIWGMFLFIGFLIFILQFVKDLNFEKRIVSIGFVVILILYSFVSYYDLINYKNEKNFWLNARESSPEKLKIITKLYEISNDEGDYYSAEKYLQKSIKIAPKDMELRFKLSELYLNQNRKDDAILVLLDLVKEFDNFTAVYQLVSIYIETGKVEAANSIAKNQIRNEEEKMKILNIYDVWAKNYFRKKDNVTMVKIMKGVLTFDPDNLEVVNYLLKTYLQLYQESKQDFLKEKIKYYINERNRIMNISKGNK